MRRILALCAAVLIAGGAQSETISVKYTHDWKWEGPSAPFLLALSRGYYAEEGLDVTMDSGAGSRESIPRVASGAYDIGFGDINSVIKFRDQNPEIGLKAVLMVYNRPPFAIIGRKSLGVTAPKDLEGRVLGAPAPDAAYAQWNAFVAAAGIDASKVTIENVGFPVREPMLARGEVDAVAGFSFSSFINLKAAGVPEDDIAVILMSEHGLEMYGNAVIVNPAFAEAHHEAVAGFVRATIRGVMDMMADPAAAVEYVLERNDIARREVELERLEMSIEQAFLGPELAEIGFGAIDEGRFARAMEQIAQTYDFQNPIPEASAIFDDSFLPPRAEREVR
jgi:NitT/TauT family transport system substrate-binding protein